MPSVPEIGRRRTSRFLVQMLIGCCLALFSLGIFPQLASANLNINTTTPTQAQLKAALEGNVATSNVTVNTGSIAILPAGTSGQARLFSNGTTVSGLGPVIGIEDGIALVTGTASTAVGRNNSFSRTTGTNTVRNDPDLATVDSGRQFDTIGLQFQVVPAGNFMALDFVFASEEYNEFVCTIFNDAMGIFVSGPGITGKANIAKLENNLAPIAVNQINRGVAGSYAVANPGQSAPCDLGNAAFYVNNVDPTSSENPISANNTANATTQTNYTHTQYDGFTIPLTAQLAVTPGATYTVKVVVADIGDAQWDSAVFLDGISSYNLDLGDAPNSYGTNVIDQSIQLPGPARHSTGQDLYLGAISPDAENTVTPAIAPNPAIHDDTTGIDDEDAFDGDWLITPGITNYSLADIPVHNGTGTPATLMGWIDFNQNGNFLDAGELAEVVVSAGQTTATLTWAGFTAPIEGTAYARFRITTDTQLTNNPSPRGLALNGEVEDYRVLFGTFPQLSLVKRITAINQEPINPNDGTPLNTVINPEDDAFWPSNVLVGATEGGLVKPGDELEYTVYFLSSGTGPITNVSICDLIPTHTRFVANTFNGQTPLDSGGLSGTDVGIALASSSETIPTAPTVYLTNTQDGDRGLFYPAGTDLPAACTGANTNGAVVVNVVSSPDTLPPATAPGTPPNAYGFVRFRAQVIPTG